MNISYTKKYDYLLPNSILENTQQYNIENYGLLKLKYNLIIEKDNPLY